MTLRQFKLSPLGCLVTLVLALMTLWLSTTSTPSLVVLTDVAFLYFASI